MSQQLLSKPLSQGNQWGSMEPCEMLGLPSSNQKNGHSKTKTFPSFCIIAQPNFGRPVVTVHNSPGAPQIPSSAPAATSATAVILHIDPSSTSKRGQSESQIAYAPPERAPGIAMILFKAHQSSGSLANKDLSSPFYSDALFPLKGIDPGS